MRKRDFARRRALKITQQIVYNNAQLLIKPAALLKYDRFYMLLNCFAQIQSILCDLELRFLRFLRLFLHFCMTFVLPKDVYFVSEQTIEAV